MVLPHPFRHARVVPKPAPPTVTVEYFPAGVDPDVGETLRRHGRYQPPTGDDDLCGWDPGWVGRRSWRLDQQWLHDYAQAGGDWQAATQLHERRNQDG
jgi:hypothetical protein